MAHWGKALRTLLTSHKGAPKIDELRRSPKCRLRETSLRFCTIRLHRGSQTEAHYRRRRFKITLAPHFFFAPSPLPLRAGSDFQGFVCQLRKCLIQRYEEFWLHCKDNSGHVKYDIQLVIIQHCICGGIWAILNPTKKIL